MTTNTEHCESIKGPIWAETWFWEQLLYVAVCLVPAMLASYTSLAAKSPVTARDIFLLIGTTFAQFVAQKVRSAASRQAALIKRLGHTVPEVRCAPKIKKWAAIAQILGAFLSVATAPTWWHMPGVLWAVVVYELWRSHREARKS